jgi:hypothetical protein
MLKGKLDQLTDTYKKWVQNLDFISSVQIGILFYYELFCCFFWPVIFQG